LQRSALPVDENTHTHTLAQSDNTPKTTLISHMETSGPRKH